MTPQEIMLPIFMGLCGLVICSVVLFILAFWLACRAQQKARKQGLRTSDFDWWLYKRHLDWIKYSILGPIKCFFSGHKIWKVFIWSMSSPGEGYCQGHCSQCCNISHVSHPIPMSDSELIAWLEDNYPDSHIIHLGSHCWPSRHVRGTPVRVVSTSGQVIDEDQNFGSGHMRVFFYDLKPTRRPERPNV